MAGRLLYLTPNRLTGERPRGSALSECCLRAVLAECYQQATSRYRTFSKTDQRKHRLNSIQSPDHLVPVKNSKVIEMYRYRRNAILTKYSLTLINRRAHFDFFCTSGAFTDLTIMGYERSRSTPDTTIKKVFGEDQCVFCVPQEQTGVNSRRSAAIPS